ncbi:MAG: glycerophosphoryl diester phosphodiesterase membrane domain-containing protein [Candidatus Micrarchaeota archaeon]|nr:glycerophosphoryl diester phosphodiesterase membrane domain-containing protein [Candidatus Micrarchaeota archaeon]MDE1824444.1 glycerophosphoryl diester phosphodiesterase membrane domain-containing protein [Candidatus Micrarchaeota archaeon]MDE1849623.1 glycerophosphoryl diester phosphodiesterase membrane domain-containing protein [Candidatus Micrarchaeota archaeon]
MGIQVVDAVSSSITRLFTDRGLLLMSVIESAILIALSMLYSSGPISNITGTLSSVNPSDVGTIAAGILQLIALVIVTLLVQAFFVFAILSKSFYGIKMGVNEAFNASINRYFTGIIAALVIGIAIVVPYVVLILLAALAPIAIVLFVPYLIYVVYVSTMLSLSLPYAVIGKQGAIDSLRSSWNSVKGSWWSVFSAYLLLGAVYLVVSIIIQLPVYLQLLPAYFSAFASGAASPAQAQALTATATSVANSPIGIATGFVAQILGAWLVILFAMVYSQLSKPQEQQKQPKPASKMPK